MENSEVDDRQRSFTRKGQATRDRIVAAAASLIFEGGVAGTSVENVQKAAGVSASQLYHYFGDKQTLVRAVIAHQTESILAAQQPHLAELDSLEAFRAWAEALVQIERDLGCKGGCPIGTLTGELAEVCPPCREDLATGFARWEEALGRGLHTMRERGELRPDVDPDRLALALLAAVQGGLLLTQVRRDPAPLEAALDAMLDQLGSLAPAHPGRG